MDRTTERSRPARASAATNLAAIVSHPTRRRCWSALYGRVASPKELADEFGYPTQHVDYHLKRLEKLGIVQLVDTRPVNGATEHFYAITQPYNLREKEVAEIGPEASAASLTYIFQLEVADAAAALESGKMAERPDHHVSRRPLELDEPGWAAIYAAFEEFGERLDEVQAEATARTAHDPEALSVQGMAHLNLFEMPDPDDRVKQF